MADTKVSDLASLAGSGVDIAADVVPIVDTSATTTKKILASNLLGSAYTAAGDIVQASAAGVAARLGIGTARQVQFVNAGATALAYLNPITLATEQASTSGTEIDFTSIPAAVRRITIMFVGVSTSGGSTMIIQLGDAGGFEATGYTSAAVNIMADPTTIGTSTAGFIIDDGTSGGSAIRRGKITLTLEDASDFTWIAEGTIYESFGSGRMYSCVGTKALSAELTQVRITTSGGSQTFDAGVINISYE